MDMTSLQTLQRRKHTVDGRDAVHEPSERAGWGEEASGTQGLILLVPVREPGRATPLAQAGSALHRAGLSGTWFLAARAPVARSARPGLLLDPERADKPGGKRAPARRPRVPEAEGSSGTVAVPARRVPLRANTPAGWAARRARQWSGPQSRRAASRSSRAQ